MVYAFLYNVAAGGIIAGIISDRLNARAVTCVSFLLLAVPFVRMKNYIMPSILLRS